MNRNEVHPSRRLFSLEWKSLRVWISMVSGFSIATAKFIVGCVAGNGFLCVSALHSALLAIAKHKCACFSGAEKKPASSEAVLFHEIGLLILFSGIVYGVYMGRLIPYPEDSGLREWKVALIAMAAVCIAEVAASFCELFHTPEDGSSLLLLAGKLLNLASALPAAVMAQIALNACAFPLNMSYWNGISGILIGAVLFFMGAFMVWHKRRIE